MKPTLEEIDPHALVIHPILNDFPDLTPPEYEALKASIAADYAAGGPGVLVELRAIPLEDGTRAVYAGRHRRRAALELGIPSVPVMVNGRDPKKLMEFVIDEVTTGRQLTKSGLALILFERHPSLVAGAKERKGGRPKKPVSEIQVSGAAPETEGEASISQVAERYQVPREYFLYLGKIRHGQPAGEGALKLEPASEEEWTQIRKAIIEDQTPVKRIWAGWNGRGSTVSKAKAPTDYAGTCRTGLIQLKGAFQHWKQVPVKERTELIGLWQELQTLIPEDLQ